MTTYINIPKPTGTSYTPQNFIGGGEQYDQASLTYDDVGTFYDGINPSQYTGVTKPTGTSYTTVAKP